MKIQLSDHFSFSKLLRFTLPSIVMMVFTSIYGVVDGFFISNYVGTSEFAAVNLIMPFIQILGSIGFMLGSGGSALVAKTLGEGDGEKAKKIFSMITYIGIILAVVFTAAGELLIEPVARLLGADDVMLPTCVEYGRIVLITLLAYMLQNMFQSFLVTAEKPTLGLIITVIAGVTNMVLDAVFVAVLEWGVAGAAVATCIAQVVGGVIPLIYFVVKNNSLLRLVKPYFNIRELLGTCANGSSEMVTNISMSVVAILYNARLMEFAGENGVAAYGAVMYVSYIFVAVFLGYSIGVAPVVGYHYGAENTTELKGILKRSLVMVAVAGVIFALIAYLLSSPLAKLFLGAEAVKNNPSLISMTVDAFHCFAISVLFCGFSIFGSAFFTALNNGAVSAAISFLRTLLFQIVTVMVLPNFFELDGIWYSLFCSEALAVVVTAVFLLAMRKKYKY